MARYRHAKLKGKGSLGSLFFCRFAYLPFGVMSNPSPPASDSSNEPIYCRFGKRNLDRMSWLGPLLNNEIGDRLNLELRHEHLFFIQGDRVLKDIGYSEKGRRFSEIEFGKPIRTLEDLKKNGYWLVGGTYDPAVMEEALARQHDGYYYCFFSNQCQDWTDRLRRAAERLETERGLDSRQLALGSTNSAYYSKPVSPTEPASVLMGLLTLAIGVAAIVGRIVAGPLFTSLLGVLFLISAAAHVVYAFHAGDWRNMLSILLTGAGLSLAGVLILLDRYFAAIAMGTLLTILIAVYGLGSVALGVSSRPLRRGLGPLGAGLFMLALAILFAIRWPTSGDAALGLWVGLALIAGGGSTIWLSWMTRREDASPKPG